MNLSILRVTVAVIVVLAIAFTLYRFCRPIFRWRIFHKDAFPGFLKFFHKSMKRFGIHGGKRACPPAYHKRLKLANINLI